MSMFKDMGNESVIGLWNKQSLLLAAVGYLGINIQIRGAGRDFENTSDIEMRAYFTDTGMGRFSCGYLPFQGAPGEIPVNFWHNPGKS